jgi:hypothetical protein
VLAMHEKRSVYVGHELEEDMLGLEVDPCWA